MASKLHNLSFVGHKKIYLSQCSSCSFPYSESQWGPKLLLVLKEQLYIKYIIYINIYKLNIISFFGSQTFGIIYCWVNNDRIFILILTLILNKPKLQFIRLSSCFSFSNFYNFIPNIPLFKMSNPDEFKEKTSKHHCQINTLWYGSLFIISNK